MAHKHPVIELFAQRCTIRDYQPGSLAQGDLERIIEAGRRAPTGARAQIYSVIRINDVELRERLASLAGNQQHIRDAAEFFIFCVDLHRVRQLIEHRDGTYDAGERITVQYGTMEALLVAANMATAAEALGYGTCFIGAVLNHLDAVAREVRLPEGVVPVVGLTVGVPRGGQGRPRSRLPRRLVFHTDHYRKLSASDLDAAYDAMGQAWYDTLARYFGPNGMFARRETVWKRTLEQQGLEATEGGAADD